MAEKVKKCPKCKQESNWLFSECEHCGADISKETIIEKASRYDHTRSGGIASTSDYLRIVGWVFLGICVIAAVYLVYNFTFIETVSLLTTYSRREFSPIGIISGAVSLVFGAAVHAITRGIAEILERG